MSELLYNTLNDQDVFVQQQMEIRGHTYNISAVTSAGQKEYGGPRKSNEDALSVMYSEHEIIAAIFDGASSQKPIQTLKEQGFSGARYASHTLKHMFEAEIRDSAVFPEAAVLLDGLNIAIGGHYREYLGVDYTDLNMLPSCTATILHIDETNGRLNTAHVTDSFATVLYEDGSTDILTDNRHLPFDTEVLDYITELATADPSNVMTNRIARKDPRIRERLMAMMQGRRNTPDGSGEGIVNGDPAMRHYIDARSISLDGVKAVLLGSDGIVPPGMSEREANDRKILMEIACNEGVQGLLEYTHATEDADQDWNNVRYSHADDATAILIQRA
jgi:serine/threonine protein phosphatase PrpC